MSEHVCRLKKLAMKFDVAPIASCVLDAQGFSYWSGSSCAENHHYGDGGLAKHTLEVAELCLLNAARYDGVNTQKLFLAALFHDAGKMWDYKKVDGVWQADKHKKFIHHLSRSAMVWYEAMYCYDYNDFDDEVLHAILAHHGRREYGSPVSPQTKLAWLLHLCDSISARLDECQS